MPQFAPAGDAARARRARTSLGGSPVRGSAISATPSSGTLTRSKNAASDKYDTGRTDADGGVTLVPTDFAAKI
jgi:hypothetical protein